MGVAGHAGNRFADQLDRQFCIAGLMRQNAHQVQGFGMIRKLGQNLPQNRFARLLLPSVNLLGSNLQGLRDGHLLALRKEWGGRVEIGFVGHGEG